jgi:2-methylaconitate isomerase
MNLAIKSPNKIYAKYIRGGTSKGLYILDSSLPLIQPQRDEILLKIMGSPDPTGLQIDGMGGGITSTSKVALISKIKRNNQEFLNYNFGQVSIKEAKVDWSGNCGNIASGLFEFVKEEKEYLDCLEEVQDKGSNYSHKLRVWQENKKHEMCIWGNINHSSEKVCISGIKLAYPPLFVEFKDIVPIDSNLFPTKNLIDRLQLSDTEIIEATLISGANPLAVIHASALGLKGNEIPSEINYFSIKERLDLISKKAAEKMKIQLTDAFRIAWVASPSPYTDTSNNLIDVSKFDILSRITTNSRIHHAHTGTGAINIAVAALIKGTIPNTCLIEDKRRNFSDSSAKKEIVLNKSMEGQVIIGHPGGLMICEGEVNLDGNDWRVSRAGFIRHARMLMEGWIYF